MILQEDVTTENAAPRESLYDSRPVAPVVTPSAEDVKAQELFMFWRIVREAHQLAREPLTYSIMRQMAELADDLEVMLIHTESPSLRARARYRLDLYYAWRQYNNRPWPAHVRAMVDPVDILFNRAGAND